MNGASQAKSHHGTTAHPQPLFPKNYKLIQRHYPNTAYDENGNIKAMWQKGWQLGGSNPIDSLNYTYNNNSNKLKNVIDGRNDPLTTMGDFRTSSLSPYNTGKTSSAQDYYYDLNGNLTRDLNKDIGSQTADGIIYNHLNLPWQVSVRSATGTKGTIKYIYDATGNKLKKTTADSAGNIQTVTTYISGFQYQGRQSISAGGTSADTLQFFGQEEGRVRVLQDTTGGKPAPTFSFDYFIKDHLGNTRMVLTEEQQTDMYPAATMEVGDSATENLYYSKLTDTRSYLPPGYPTDTTTNPNNYVIGLTGTSGHTIGPGITLKVMAGDQFSIKASSWYKANGASPGNPVNPLTDLLTALIGGVGAIPGGHLTATQLTTNSGLISPNVTQFLADTGTSILNTRPHAFVNWVLFDNQMNYVSASSGFDQVGTDQQLKKHIQTNLPITKSGYLYIYVSNETPNIEVFFDNVQVTHTRGPLLEENHYYPFGLTMAGISDKALKGNYAENKVRFQKQELQNKEFSDGSGLEMYQFKYRMDDPQTGRFWSIDPLADKYVYNSTYAFSENKVTGHVELEGLEAADARIDRDLHDVESGKITTEQLSDRLNVRGKSDLLAAGVGIFSLFFGPEETVGLGRFIFGVARSSSKEEGKTPQGAPKSQDLQKAEDRANKLSEKPRPGEKFTKAGKEAVKDVNKAKNEGQMKCENCGQNVENASQHSSGETPPSNEAHVDHIEPRSGGGSGTPNNGQVLCRTCNLEKGAKPPPATKLN